MAIVMGESGHYWWPVKHDVPAGEGKKAPVSFLAKFNRLSESEVKEIQAEAKAGDVTDDEIVDRLLAGWKKMKGLEVADGKEPDFSIDEQRDWVLDFMGMPNAVVKAWRQSNEEGKRKN